MDKFQEEFLKTNCGRGSLVGGLHSGSRKFDSRVRTTVGDIPAKYIVT